MCACKTWCQDEEGTGKYSSRFTHHQVGMRRCLDGLPCKRASSGAISKSSNDYYILYWDILYMYDSYMYILCIHVPGIGKYIFIFFFTATHRTKLKFVVQYILLAAQLSQFTPSRSPYPSYIAATYLRVHFFFSFFLFFSPFF